MQAESGVSRPIRGDGSSPPARIGLSAVSPIVIIAAIVALLIATVGLTALIVSHSAQPISATTVVAGAQSQSSTTSTTDASAAGANKAQAAAAGPTNAAVNAGAVIGPSCAGAPTVQFQGRGLAATGSAPITTSAAAPSTVSASVQEHGTDLATVIGNAQAKAQAVTAALQQAGVPASSIQNGSLYSYSSGGQVYAYASVQAQVGSDQLVAATRAVAQVAGITNYSTYTGLPAEPTSAEVQAAVTLAAAQARDMATATARAAGVKLGSAQSIATQPPAPCYFNGAQARVIQVTVTYALT